MEEKESTIITEETQSKVKTCTNDEIKEGKCSDGSMKNDQVKVIFEDFKNSVLNEEYKGENKVIETENVILQISTLEEQKNSLNPNISTIDLGECESILKSKNNISEKDSLIILKTDIKSADLSSTYVQYEVYDPNTLKKLDLNECNEVKIVVSVPVNLDSETISLYDSMSESGYNLFDSEDDFYNDICSTYTSANGTDMTLADRKKEIYSMSGNVSMCQTGCLFESYNKTTKKAKCNCDAQNESTQTDMTKIDFESNSIKDSFLSTLTNSNFYVLKCYKLALKFSNFIKNKGRMIMSVILVTFVVFLFIHFIKDRKTLKNYIQILLQSKMSKTKNQKIKEKVKKKSKNKKNNQKVNKKSKIGKKKKDKSKINVPTKKKFNNKLKKDILTNSTQTNLMSKKYKKNIDLNINIIPINNINYKNSHKNGLKNLTKNNDVEIYKSKFLKTDKENANSEKNLLKSVVNLNDQELNTLEYEIAVIYDKRTYFQYYWSLLKKKHLILFTFLPSNDYNLFTIKISLFLLSFSLYFTINGFFFSDDTMHKIHEDKGAFNIMYQIPQILYSSVISAIINMILKMLSLSEQNILIIKQEKNINLAIKKSKKIERYIIIKFIIFFFLSTILLLFFWYFISCFCAVYTNTQIILIKDTLVSFGLSMLYPFGLNLLPGMFRIPALRAKNKDKACLYKASGLIAYI